ncbi:MAG: cation:proton antiporter [Methanomassiliicoccaceae archaeon]|nr:cation:proton antiporter [Methanomassiliicoccaceae archaeon]
MGENIFGELTYIFLQLFVLLLLAKILGSIFEKYELPKLIGEILAGVLFINLVILSPGVFEEFLNFTVANFDGNKEHFLYVLGELGIVFLLFSVGLEIKFGDLMKVGKVATYIAMLALIIPLAAGMLFYFYPFITEEISWKAALLIGTALFGMSTAVSVECLRNLGAMNSTEAKIIVSTAVIDDILCLALLGVVIGMINPDSTPVTIAITAMIVAVFILSMFLITSRVKGLAARRKRRKEKKMFLRMESDAHYPMPPSIPAPMSEFNALGLAILVCIGLAALSMYIGLAAIIGAFLAGMLFAEFRDTMPVEHNFNVITYFMLPFFFIWVGMNVHLDVINAEILLLLAVIIVVAIITKYVAGYFGARRAGHYSKETSHLIGVSLIPRGEVGIIVAVIGLKGGVFGPDLFAVIILMALITSLITPPLVKHAYRKMEKSRSAVYEEIFTERGEEPGDLLMQETVEEEKVDEEDPYRKV